MCVLFSTAVYSPCFLTFLRMSVGSALPSMVVDE